MAADVCKCLGMSVASGTHKWLQGLFADERNTTKIAGGNRGNPNVTLISGSGLYKLAMRSDRPEAAKFCDWVTRDVLPSIRKNGGYIAGQEKLASGELSDAEFLARSHRL